MRKILASILVLAMALASFGMVAFAAPTTDVYFGVDGVTAVTATEDTYTVEVYYNPASHAVEYDGVYYIGSFSVDTAVTNATSVTKAATITNLENSDTNNNKIMFSTSGDAAELTGAVKVADITVTRADGAATSVLTLSAATAADYDGNYEPTSSALTITWPAAAGTPSIVKADVVEKNTLQGNDYVYTGVWTGDYVIALNGNVTSKAAVQFAEKAEDAFAVEVEEIGGTGNVAFKIAILGVPAGAEATPAIYAGNAWVVAE